MPPRVHWKHFGLLTKLVFVSSLLGVVFNVSSMEASLSFRAVFSNTTLPIKYDHMAHFHLWSAIQGLFAAAEFFCLSLSKLLVIDRLLGPLREVFSRERKVQMVRLLSIGERIALTIVVVSCTCALGCRTAAAVFSLQISSLLAGDTESDTQAQSQFPLLVSRAFYAVGVQFAFLFTTLLTLIIVFSLTGLMFRMRFRAYEDAGEGSLVASVKRRVYYTLAVVFFSLLLRMCYTLYAAVGFFGYGDDELFSFTSFCLSDPCSPVCFSTNQINSHTIVLSPVFYRILSLISGPLTMGVSLWGLRPKAHKANTDSKLLTNGQE